MEMTTINRALRPLCLVGLVGLLGLVLVVPAGAQPITIPKNTRPPGERPAPTANDPRLPPTLVATNLSREQLRIETVGLSMSVPEGSVVVQASTGDGTLSFNVVPGENEWAMAVSTRRTKSDQTSVQQMAEGITKQMLALAPLLDAKTREMTYSRVEVLHRDMDFRVAGCATPGARLYFAIPNENGPRGIKGYTVFKPLPGLFVLFELSTAEPQFDKARAAYELAVATAAFVDPTVALKARADALANGLAFAGQLDVSALQRALPEGQQAFRLYQPGTPPQPDTEKGYRIITYERGKRSDLGRDVAMSSTRDDPEGIIMTIQARILAPNGMVIDSESNAFSAYDRSSEAWVSRTSVREKDAARKQPQVFTETGVRQGKSLSVFTRQPGKPDRSAQHELQGREYLSQVEVQLLPMLLDRASAEGELGFYAYRSDTGTVSLRRERVQGQKDGSKITTTLRDSEETQTTLVRDSSRYVRTELPDGSLWEPIEPEALLRLWRSKSLPTGK